MGALLWDAWTPGLLLIDAERDNRELSWSCWAVTCEYAVCEFGAWRLWRVGRDSRFDGISFSSFVVLLVCSAFLADDFLLNIFLALLFVTKKKSEWSSFLSSLAFCLSSLLRGN